VILVPKVMRLTLAALLIFILLSANPTHAMLGGAMGSNYGASTLGNDPSPNNLPHHSSARTHKYKRGHIR
jgi:hypothetical protein